MAINYFKNEKTYPVEVPIATSGSITVEKGEFVKGSFFDNVVTPLTDKGSSTPSEVTANAALLVYTQDETASQPLGASVGTAELESKAVTAAKIDDATITATQLASNAVTAAKILADAVTTAKILDANVTTAKIADLNVTAGKLAADAVTTAKILDGAVTNVKLGAPKIVVYSEVIAVGDFTDGGGAAGTLALSTTIPAGAVFMQAAITNIVGFAGDTTAVITIGDGTDGDRYNTGTPSVFATAAAGVDLGVPSGTLFHAAVKTPTVTVTTGTDFGLTVTDANGAATITLVYLLPA